MELRRETPWSRALSGALAMLGVALAGLLGLGAIKATAAEFHSESGHTVLSGTQIGEAKFTFSFGSVVCKKGTFTGTQSSATVTSLSLESENSECTAFGFIAATIHKPRGCRWEFTGTMGPTVTNFVHLVGCPSAWTITTPVCDITINNQVNLGNVVVHNRTGPKRIEPTMNLSGLVYTQDPTGPLGCPAGQYSNGQLLVIASISGSTTGGAGTGIWLE
jgi:hypothetical protein